MLQKLGGLNRCLKRVCLQLELHVLPDFSVLGRTSIVFTVGIL